MKHSQQAVWNAVYVFVPDAKIMPQLQIPEALNMAAVEMFMIDYVDGPKAGRYTQARRLIYNAIKEIRANGSIHFGDLEYNGKLRRTATRTTPG